MSRYFLKKFKNKGLTRTTSTTTTGSSFLLLHVGSGESDSQVRGFPSSYIAPVSNYVAPTEKDPNFEILKPTFSDPYWVSSLEMDRWDEHITPMIEILSALFITVFLKYRLNMILMILLDGA